MHASQKLAVRIAALGLGLGAVAIPVTVAHASVPHGTTASPTLTVTPDSGLKDGDKVTVSGTNFPASKTPVYVTQCSTNTGDASDCNLNEVNTDGSTDSSGSFSGVKYTVNTGKFGSASCKPGGTCYIAASTAITGQDTTNSALAPITFATGKGLKTKTSAKFATSSDKVKGKVTVAGTGVKGVKAVLDLKAHGKWKKVEKLKTGKGGKFTSRKLTRSGKYEVKTPKQKPYKASHSKVIKVKV
jgi:hypothetical protein